MLDVTAAAVPLPSALATPSTCCFWWEVARGPHEHAVFALCLHESPPRANGDESRYIVGRHKRSWMRLLKDVEVSSTHAEFRVVASPALATSTEAASHPRHHVLVCDLGSTNGTKVNGKLLAPRRDHILVDQDLVYFGKTAVRFRVAPPPPSSSSQHAEPPDVIEIDLDGTEGNGSAEDSERQLTQQEQRDDSTGSADGDSERSASVSIEQLSTATVRDAAVLPSGSSSTLPPIPSSEPAPEPAPLISNTFATSIAAPVGLGWVSDSDEFELAAPSSLRQLVSARALAPSRDASATALDCMICARSLSHLDVLEQQLHINACLDGRTDHADTASWSFIQHQDGSTSGTGATNRRRPKRPRAAASVENDDVAMALAMSKSTMNQEQEVDMALALLSGELAQLDAQMAKLAKKRDVLQRRLIKLEKTKARVKRSVVLAPSEARVLLDLSKALDALFPSNRRLDDDATNHINTAPKPVRVVAERYRPQTRAPAGSASSTWTLPSMWLRASQLQFGLAAADLYRNSVLLPFGEAFDPLDPYQCSEIPSK